MRESLSGETSCLLDIQQHLFLKWFYMWVEYWPAIHSLFTESLCKLIARTVFRIGLKVVINVCDIKSNFIGHTESEPEKCAHLSKRFVRWYHLYPCLLLQQFGCCFPKIVLPTKNQDYTFSYWELFSQI